MGIQKGWFRKGLTIFWDKSSRVLFSWSRQKKYMVPRMVKNSLVGKPANTVAVGIPPKSARIKAQAMAIRPTLIFLMKPRAMAKTNKASPVRGRNMMRLLVRNCGRYAANLSGCRAVG